MKAVIAVATTTTAIVSLIFLGSCVAFFSHVGLSVEKQEQCEADYMAAYGRGETEAALRCLDHLN